MSMLPNGEQDQEGSLSYQGWRVVLGSFLALILSPSTMAMISFGISTPYLIDEFGWSIGQVSIGMTLASVATLLATPLQGLLIDRFGARAVILASAPVFGTGYAMFGLQTGELWQFYLGWTLVPLAGLGLWPASYSKATASWFTRRLGLAIAIATTGIGVGSLVIPLLVAGISGSYGWRAAFIGIGISAAVISWLMAFLLIREAPGAVEKRAAASKSLLLDQLHTRSFGQLAMAFLLLGVFSSLVSLHQVHILIENGEARDAAISITAITGAAVICGRVVVGYLLDHISVNVIMPACALLACLGIILYLMGANGPSAYCAAFLVGLMVGAEIDVMGYIAKTHFPLAVFGAIYGLLFSLFQMGNAIGAAVLGMLRTSTGAYNASLLALLGVMAFVMLLFATLPRPRIQERHSSAGSVGLIALGKSANAAP